MDISRQPAKAPTDFEARVYGVVRRIPAGSVATYGAVAASCGCGSARAVGRALGKNPFAPEVPCHRVVRGDGALGGFFGETGRAALEAKRRLLEREGILFEENGRVAGRFIRRRL
ncbi:MAG: MGMT family protein [Verrucomicrobiota bacterium]